MRPGRTILAAAAAAFLSLAVAAGARAQGTRARPTGARAPAAGGITGVVTDVSGGVVGGVLVEAFGGARASATSDPAGAYRLADLPAGTYTVLATKDRFAPFVAEGVVVPAGRVARLDVTLQLAPIVETAIVHGEGPLGLDPDESAGAIVLRGGDLDALPDDAEDLASALQALAGPAAGPGGGQVLVDGFSIGRLPPKSAIREIRLNANPFSAEFERPGFGRVAVSTRRGMDRVRGNVAFEFTNDRLGEPDPFSPARPAFERAQWSGSLGTPLTKKASLLVDFEHRSGGDEQLVHATVLGTALEARPLNLALAAPDRRTMVSPRLEFQLGAHHAVLARYSFTEDRREQVGVGGFALASTGTSDSDRQHALQVTETAILGSRLSNEARAHYVRQLRRSAPDDISPTLEVLEAFVGGGSPLGLSSREQEWVEVRNLTTWTPRKHTVRIGVRARGTRVTEASHAGFGGIVTFAGGLAPVLDESGAAMLGRDGRPLLAAITSLERHRRTLLLQEMGLSGAEIRERGGGAAQLRIAGGEPQASATQGDVAAFLQDDWKLASTLTLSLGLRYEDQTNIRSHGNVAPRAAFAWSARSRDGRPRTVVRGGVGVFYERVAEDLTLQARRFDGDGRREFLVTAPEVLDSVRYAPGAVLSLPSVAELGGFARAPVVRRLDPALETPRMVQASLSFEQLLPGGVTFSIVGVSTRIRRALRSRNVNAPLPGTGALPLGGSGPVYQYESSGRFDQEQLIVGLNSRTSRTLTLFARYFLGRARSDTNGPHSFPANQYDLTAEYGPASIDVRHRFTAGGSLRLPWGVRLSPFVVAASGRPFNITTGRDDNGDTLFTDRPAFAADPAAPGMVHTPWGVLDPRPRPGQAPIPRNLGRGPAFFMMNLRLSKAFGFGSSESEDEGAPSAPRTPPPAGEEDWAPDDVRRRRSAAPPDDRVTLTLSVNVQNLFNRVNDGLPVGNMSSPSFGRVMGSAGPFGAGGAAEGGVGSRRIELQARLTF